MGTRKGIETSLCADCANTETSSVRLKPAVWGPHSSCCDTPLPWHPCALLTCKKLSGVLCSGSEVPSPKQG